MATPSATRPPLTGLGESLLDACRTGDAALAAECLSRGAHPDAADDDGLTAAHFAALCGAEGCLDALLNAGADVDTRTLDGFAPLALAAMEGHSAAVRLLLKHTRDPNIATEDGETPLMLAAAEGHADVVRLLSGDPRVDAAKRDRADGWTAFMRACLRDQVDAVRVLVGEGARADLNARALKGETAFLLACREGAARTVGFLLDNVPREHLTFDEADAEGNNAFHAACAAGRAEVAELLLSHPAKVNPNHRNLAGATGFALACARGDPSLVERLMAYDDVLLLDARDDCGATAFWHACARNDPAIVRVFLAHQDRADVSRPDRAGVAPRDVCSPELRALIDREVLLHAANHRRLRVCASEITVLRDRGPLGRGGYGEVYPGAFRGLPVAVKLLRRPEGDSPDARRLLEREVGIWSHLAAHPNILQLTCYAPDPPMMVSPFADGGDLHAWLARWRADARYPEIGLRALHDVAGGMAWVHSQHVVHGDLKPANVLLDRGRAKIADFGMSRVRMDVSAPASGDAGMAGTVPFMAPECLAPSPPRKRKPADVYAYGMIAWEVAARGAEPFAGEDTQALVQNVPLGYRPPRPPDTPEALWRLITRCWAHLPSDRPEFQGIAEGVARMAAGLLDSAGH